MLADYIGTGFLPPVLDLENPYSNGQAILLTEMFTSEELSLWVQEWMNEVESETGVVPYLYISTQIMRRTFQVHLVPTDFGLRNQIKI